MLGIIGGTGLTQLSNLEVMRQQVVRSPYGEPSGPLTFGRISGQEVVFLARHGYGHSLPPHMVNYRANIWRCTQPMSRTYCRWLLSAVSVQIWGPVSSTYRIRSSTIHGTQIDLL
jgi:purine nucleoside phosphorylase